MKGNDIINRVIGSASLLNEEEKAECFANLAIISIGIMRGVSGKKFTKDFLKEALNDNLTFIISNKGELIGSSNHESNDRGTWN